MRGFAWMVALLALGVALTTPAGAVAAPAWLAPEPLSDAGSGVADVAVAPSGRAVAVWNTGTDAIQASVRPPGGAWSPPATFGQSNGWSARVAIDPSGRAIAVYNACTPGCVVSARTLAPDATAWSGPQAISGATSFLGPPQVAVDASGNALIAWIDSNTAFARYRAADGTLDAAVSTLSAIGGCCPQISVAMSGNGTGIVTWSNYQGLQGFVQARTRAAGAWSPALGFAAQPIGGPYSNSLAYDPQVAADAIGNALVTWRSDSGAVLAKARSTAGVWGAEQSLATAATQDNSWPWPAMDADGTATVAWCERDAPASWVVKVRTRPVGAPFGPIVPISEPDTSKCVTRVSAGPGGAALVLWKVTGGLIRGNVRPAGGAFGAARDVSVLGGAAFATGAFDAEGNAVAAWHRGRVEAAAYDFAPPTARDLAIPATATTGTPVAMSVNPFDRFSAVGVAWGFGDGTSGAGAATSHAYAAAGRYDVAVTLTDAVGNARGAAGTIVVTNPSTGGPGIDADGDGFFSGQDCDDSNPAIRPGGKEVAGNLVDEDCNGVAAPTPRITSVVTWNGRLDRLGRSVFTRLRVNDLPANARAQLRCTGKRCTFKRRNGKRRPGGTVNLLPLLGPRRRVAPGVTFEVWLTAPRTIGKVVRFRTTRRRYASGVIYCVPVGATKPQKKCA